MFKLLLILFILNTYYLYIVLPNFSFESLPHNLNDLLMVKPDTMKYSLMYQFIFIIFLIIKFLFKLLGYETDPISVTFNLFKSFLTHESKRNINVDNVIDQYNDLQNDDATSLEKRNTSYSKLVDAYYELATMFYEWGWGSSFHFSYRRPFESFFEGIRRHEYYLAGKLGIKPNDKLLDCGCGIGGPMRNISLFTNANITGVTINQYQVNRGNELNKKWGLEDKCLSVQADFMDLPFDDDHFDGVYAIEATCHAPDRHGVYGEIYRVLKPGGIFACYEWCLTDKYDPDNKEHRRIKKAIEEGDGLPDMIHTSKVDEALENVGFEIIESRDVALDENKGGRVWYEPLLPSWNPLTQRFQFNWLGMFLTTNILWLLEKIYLAPKGTHKIQTMLQQGGIGCSQGGLTGTFTPMYLSVVRKPLDDENNTRSRSKKRTSSKAKKTSKSRSKTPRKRLRKRK